MFASHQLQRVSLKHWRVKTCREMQKESNQPFSPLNYSYVAMASNVFVNSGCNRYRGYFQC